MKALTISGLRGSIADGIDVESGKFHHVALGIRPNQVWVPIHNNDASSMVTSDKIKLASVKMLKTNKILLVKEVNLEIDQLLIRWKTQAPYQGNLSIKSTRYVKVIAQKKFRKEDLLHLDMLLVLKKEGNIILSRYGDKKVNGDDRFPDVVSLSYETGDACTNILNYEWAGENLIKSSYTIDTSCNGNLKSA